MASEHDERFYDDVVAKLRDTFTKVSAETWTPPPAVDKAKIAELLAHLPPKQRRMIPHNPRSPELRVIRQVLPPFQPSYAGFELVALARLGTFILIAFRWRKTKDETFVQTVDLSPFATGPYGVDVTEAIVSMNLLEKLGTQWYTHSAIRRINGLSFLE